ncbi:hypothetical protein L6267_02580 [Candidatus Parcubacteria bacterium]|nr:hypothetical protein [Candidatus Parcubacteria bacterium]
MITRESLIDPVSTDPAVSLLSEEKCEACGDQAMHYIMVKGKKVFHCPKKICIFALTNREI